MKIIYFHQYFTTPKGSDGTRSFEIARSLVKKGHDVTIVCLRNERSFTGINKNESKRINIGFVQGIRIVELNIFYRNNMGIFKRSKKFLSYSLLSLSFAFKENFDLVFCTSTPLTAGIPGIFLKWIKGTAFVFEVRDLWPELPRAMGIIKNKFILFSLRCLELITYKSADSIIGLAPGICKSIINDGVPEKIISFIPNGCDLDLFKPKNKIYTQDLRLKEENKKIFNAVFCGAHGIANGLESILDAADVLQKKQINNIKFTLIGDGIMKNKLIQIAKIKKLENCFFEDPMSKNDLAIYLQNSADLGLMILKNIEAFYEGTSPNKFFDYISSGLPVLINYPGWLSEIIIKQGIGVSVEPDNPIKLASCIKNIEENEKLRNNMKLKSRKVAKNFFARSDLNNKLIKVIEETQKKYKKRRPLFIWNYIYFIFK